MRRIDNDWEFVPEWSDDFLHRSVHGETVRIPHTVKELPLHSIDPMDYQMVCGYAKDIELSQEEAEKRVFVQFDAAAHIAEVYCNGKLAGEHRNGYTAFRCDVSELVHEGTNTIAVRLDTTENPSIPPFGNVVDYLTYGGIYRDVWLDIREDTYIDDVFAETPDTETVIAHVWTKGDMSGKQLRFTVLDEEDTAAQALFAPNQGTYVIKAPGVKPWNVLDGHVYTLRTEIVAEDRCIDCREVTFGFRTIRVDDNRMYINDQPVFLRGLNRHQSYPYAGYAVPDRLQREDARILQEELGVNAVRTSHYPQSHAFMDECDRRGLLVFTEIPGWQHLGDDAWKKQAMENTREMILQYRNHPSIVIWGVRINESVDDDALYKATNLIAHTLDATRPTSGVRYFEKSSLLEDIYGYNDFSHTGDNAGCMAKKSVTPDMKKPLLITEANGHMYPTKSFDPWFKRQEHALRHGRVLNAAMADGEHMGCFQWCMFDYATHKDFGSGDRICYHGVMDSFRNPKLAAALYASQSDEKPVLAIGSPMDIGDYAGGNLGDVYAFTNADEVRLYKNDQFVKSFSASEFTALPHGPVKIDDTIGCLIKENEGYEGKKEELVREALLAAGKYGMPNLPLKYKAMLAWCMARYGMKYEEGVELYGKYVGSWGGNTVRWRFDACRDGKCVASVTKSASARLHLEAIPSHTDLTEGDTWDMAAVRIMIKDEYGNPAPYAQLPVRVEVSGPLGIIGPSIVTAEGGMCGTYVKTLGKEAEEASVTLKAEGLAPVTIRMTIRKQEDNR